MLEIHFPFKPFYITQKWGHQNSVYADHFNNPAFKLHNGIDAFTGRLDWQGKILSEFLVYCPVEGFRVESISYDADGGGNQISLISKQKIQVFDQLCWVRIYLLHAKKILVKVGDEPKVGQLLMIADNTGFSTGLHTHIGLYRLDDSLNRLDTNDATGSFDPALFFNNKYAIDQAAVSTIISNGLRYVKYLTTGV